jgi:EF-P beta-lysylation protein EpmB
MKSHWREVQRTNFTKLPELLSFLEIEEARHGVFVQHPRFALNVPYRLARKMGKNRLDDPLLRQFVPLIQEEEQVGNFVRDPVGDCFARKGEKLLQKYAHRALLLTTSACAMHCRYCFRQNFDYAPANLFEQELALIREDEGLQEVILSGGDPLSLSDAMLGALLEKLSGIPHVRIIRFHSRFPVGIPERVDASFLEILRKLRPQIVFVAHINHPKELDEEVAAAFKAMQKLGILVLNQAVLLKGVNDSVEVLEELSWRLSETGILPYYLHQLDRVEGTAHFEVAEEEGRRLIAALQNLLPGYAVPRYVKEIAGEKSKTLI